MAYESITSSIECGDLRPGATLPSSREYARELSCNKLTVLKVLQNLVLEGWLISTERQSFQVSDRIALLKRRKKSAAAENLLPNLDTRGPDTKSNQSSEDGYKYKFVAGSPDLRCFPMNDFRSTIASALRRSSDSDFGYSDPIGIPDLLKQLASYLSGSRGLGEKSIVITNGTQEAIYILARMLLKKGDVVVMESVGYPPVKRIFLSLGVKIQFVDVDNEGLRTAQLEKILEKKQIKLVYLTPLHQYPTTITLSQRRRELLKSLSVKYKFAILEDDYDYDFHYTKIPPKPIASDCSNAFYLSSLSKTMFPGIRLGFIACHSSFISGLREEKVLISRQNECLSQIAISSWIRNGDFEKHLRKMRRIYEERYRLIAATLVGWKETYDISFEQPNGGLSFWVNINRDADKISEMAKKQGVFVASESEYRFQGNECTHVRLGFSALNTDELSDSLPILARILSRQATL